MREWWSWRGRLAVDGSGMMAHIGLFGTLACVHCRCLPGSRRGTLVATVIWALEAFCQH